MKKKLVSIVLVVLLLLAAMPVTAMAARGDYDHLDVKIDSEYILQIGDETYTLTGEVVEESVLIEIKDGENVVFTSEGLEFSTRSEDGHQEFNASFGRDKSLDPAVIDWVDDTYEMTNVYVSARINLTDAVPEAAKQYLKQDGDIWYIELADYTYQGVQECTGGNGMRSEGNKGSPNGLDLYITGEAIVEEIIQTTSVSVEKVWADGDDQDGLRPEHVTVQLTADGEPSGDPVVLSEENGWKHTWPELPVEADGETIAYLVTETEVPGYTASYENGILTNTHTPETVSKTVTKVWEDGNDQDGLRPASIEVQLLADGEPCGDPVVLDESGGWAYTWTGLPAKAAGASVRYTAAEITAVDGYKTTYSEDTLTITNTHVPAADGTFAVTKVWDDGDNRDGLRPDSVTVQMLANGQSYGEPVVLSEENQWSAVWSGLPVNAGGEPIVYTVAEPEVPEGYTAAYENGVLTNTYTPAVTEFTVTKEWVDNNDQDKLRPASIEVQLLADGKAYGDPVKVTAEAGWTYTWKDLPKNADGKAVVYSVEEKAVPGYTAAYEGGKIINTHAADLIEKTVTKVWKDGEDQDGIRPDSVTVQLLADGKAYGDPVKVTAEAGWTYTWKNLPKNAGGKAIVYTFEEAAVEGYTAAYEGDSIVNTRVPAAVNVTVVKKWVDGDSKDRPTEVSVQLYADGEACGDPVKVTKDGKWAYVWKNLPKCADGKAITYTAKELNVPKGYNATYSKDTLTITNTLKDIPKTGDSDNLWLYGAVMLCAAGAAAVLFRKREWNV